MCVFGSASIRFPRLSSTPQVFSMQQQGTVATQAGISSAEVSPSKKLFPCLPEALLCSSPAESQAFPLGINNGISQETHIPHNFAPDLQKEAHLLLSVM